jgi:hypothetical protein
MADWVYDRRGRPQIIVDENRFLDKSGTETLGWRNGVNTYGIDGSDAGWFENGVLWDKRNHCVGFVAEATGDMPSRPDPVDPPPMPSLNEMTVGHADLGHPTVKVPEFPAALSQPEKGDWSNIPLEYCFD